MGDEEDDSARRRGSKRADPAAGAYSIHDGAGAERIERVERVGPALRGAKPANDPRPARRPERARAPAPKAPVRQAPTAPRPAPAAHVPTAAAKPRAKKPPATEASAPAPSAGVPKAARRKATIVGMPAGSPPQRPQTFSSAPTPPPDERRLKRAGTVVGLAPPAAPAQRAERPESEPPEVASWPPLPDVPEALTGAADDTPTDPPAAAESPQAHASVRREEPVSEGPVAGPLGGVITDEDAPIREAPPEEEDEDLAKAATDPPPRGDSLLPAVSAPRRAPEGLTFEEFRAARGASSNPPASPAARDDVPLPAPARAPSGLPGGPGDEDLLPAPAPASAEELGLSASALRQVSGQQPDPLDDLLPAPAPGAAASDFLDSAPPSGGAQQSARDDGLPPALDDEDGLPPIASEGDGLPPIASEGDGPPPATSDGDDGLITPARGAPISRAAPVAEAPRGLATKADDLPQPKREAAPASQHTDAPDGRMGELAPLVGRGNWEQVVKLLEHDAERPANLELLYVIARRESGTREDESASELNQAGIEAVARLLGVEASSPVALLVAKRILRRNPAWTQQQPPAKLSLGILFGGLAVGVGVGWALTNLLL